MGTCAATSTTSPRRPLRSSSVSPPATAWRSGRSWGPRTARATRAEASGELRPKDKRRERATFGHPRPVVAFPYVFNFEVIYLAASAGAYTCLDCRFTEQNFKRFRQGSQTLLVAGPQIDFSATV